MTSATEEGASAAGMRQRRVEMTESNLLVSAVVIAAGYYQTKRGGESLFGIM
jgi:hypothetical protein